MKESGRQKDRQRWERKEWASLVEKHSRRVKASPWGLRSQPEPSHTSDVEISSVVVSCHTSDATGSVLGLVRPVSESKHFFLAPFSDAIGTGNCTGTQKKFSF